MFPKNPCLAVTLLASFALFTGCVDNKSAPASDVPDKIISVSVAPSVISLPTGGTQQFSATVSGTNNAVNDTGNTAVTWRITEGGTGGLISSTGRYTAPASAGTYHVIASSVLDQDKTQTVIVTVSSSLDANFGTSGSVTTDFGGLDVINALAVQEADQKVVVGGYSMDGTRTRFALARYNSDGSLDATFGASGIVTTILGPSSEVNGLVLQSDGKIVAVGATSNISDSDFAIARYNSDGSLDTDFGPDGTGMVTTGISTFSDSGSNENDQANAVALQPDGKILVGGFANIATLFTSTPVGSSSRKDDFALARYNTNGTLDTTFNSVGVVITSLGSAKTGVIKALLLQTDGKIVVGGPSNGGFQVTRYSSVGVLDTTFDTDGHAEEPVLLSDEQVTTLALQADGKIIAGGFASNGSQSDFAIVRYNINGTLDTSFDGDGELTTAIGSTSEAISALLIQSNGSIIAAGFSHNGTDNDFAIARYTSSGGLDSSFGSGGITTTAIGDGNDQIKAVAFATSGIVAGGMAQNGTRIDFALARYGNDGQLDTTFDNNGSVTTVLGGATDEITSVLIQPNGKIIAGGSVFAANNRINHDFALARYDSTGTLDSDFGTAGKQTTQFASSGGNNDDEDSLQALALQNDGKIIAGGFIYQSSLNRNDFALARYNSDGSLDTSFGPGATGRVKIEISDTDEEVRAVSVQSDGKILAAGTAFVAPNTVFKIVRYLEDGTLDPSFDTDGILTTAVGSGSSALEDMILDADEKILLLGTTDNGSDLDVTLLRYNSDGSLDSNFDSDGIVTTQIGSEHDAAYALALQSDGKILVAATVITGGNSEAFTLIRYNTDGSLDTTFGSAGFANVSIGISSNAPLAIAIQADGKILAAGYSLGAVNSRDFTLVRFLSDGSLDTSFASNGIEITPFSRRIDQITALKIQSDGKIIAAGFTTVGNSNNTDFHIARYRP